MGVRGLTTFIHNRASQYLQNYELHDTYLVVDGNSLACQIYGWRCKCNDCFGGDYDKYSKIIYDFFQLLLDCEVIPLVIFDGAYEQRKLKTVFQRMKNRLQAAKNLNSVSERQITMFPLFLREVFLDVLRKLRIDCVRCEFEGDRDCAHLAKSLNCPLLSYDSDFYIFDVLYIPFPTVEIRLRRKRNYNYISCQMYNVDKFLNSFGGLDKVHLPLFAVMLGNDYIKKSVFDVFYRQLKRQKSRENEQQTLIKSLIVWLKNETTESALKKILGRYKLEDRRKLVKKIEKAVETYQWGNSQICSYFNIFHAGVEHSVLTVPKPEDIEEEGEEELIENSSEDEEDEIEESSHVVFKNLIPDFFRENFRKCLYPSCFMDMLSSDTYYCIPQIEDITSEQSHDISFDILTAIYKILISAKPKNLICVGRDEHSRVKKISLPIYAKEVPTLTDVENLDKETSKRIFLNILNLQDDICRHFPESWHLYLLSIKYWVTNSKTHVQRPYIYSLILCSIITNFVDQKIGFYRSTRSFLSKFSTSYSTKSSKNKNPTKNLMEAIDEIDFAESASCMQKLIYYFQMDAKMKFHVKLYDRNIVHEFAKFQSCLLHIKYLNSLLNLPYSPAIISKFYDGTFIYNMTSNFLKRNDLNGYIGLLLDDCPKILHVFKLMIVAIDKEIVKDIRQHDPPKRRKKKRNKPVKNSVPEISIDIENSDESYAFDANNKYSVLNFINK